MSFPDFQRLYDQVDLDDPVNRDHPLATGLVAWWETLPGLDGGTKFYDLMGLNHGTLAGMTDRSVSGWRSSQGRPGGYGSMLFDGVDDYVEVPGLNTVAVFSWVCWFYATNAANTCTMINTSSGATWQFRVNANKMDLLKAGTALIGSSTTSLVSGTWYRGGITYDAAGNYAFYLNGKPDGSGNNLQALVAAPIRLGFRGNGEGFAGLLDGVMISSRIWTARDFAFDYQESSAGNPNLLRRIPVVSYFLPSAAAAPPVTATGALSTYIPDFSRLYDQVDLEDPVNRDHPLATGLVAWWETLPGLDGGSKFYDLMGLNPGTLTNMTDRSVSGWRGPQGRPGGYGCLAGDAVNDWVNVGKGPGLVQTPPFTVVGWFNLATAAGTSAIISRGTGSWYLRVSGGQLQWLKSNQVLCLTGNTTVSASRWYHAVATVTASQDIVLYLNGIADGTVNSFQTYSSSQSTKLGADGDDSSPDEFFNGFLDGLMFYNRALTANEVSSLYQESSQGNPNLLRRTPIVTYTPPPSAAPVVTASTPIAAYVRQSARYMTPVGGVRR